MFVFQCVILVKIPVLMKITLRFHLSINKNTQHSVWIHTPRFLTSLGVFELLYEEMYNTDNVQGWEAG